MNITDNQRLVSATTRFSHAIPTYDDGYGSLWIHRDSMGISGIVRARQWEDAYSICEDEFFPEADMTVGELIAEYGFQRHHLKVLRDSTAPASEHLSAGERFATAADYIDGRLPEHPFSARLVAHFIRWKTVVTPDSDAWADNDLFQEAYGFRPNGPNAKDKIKHGIYAKDMNADSLELLTDELIAELGITINITNFYELEVTTNGRNQWPHSSESKSEAMAAFEEWRAKGHGVKLERNGEVIASHPEQVEV